MDHLDSSTNKIMAMVIIQSIMKNNTCVSTADKVQVLLVFKYGFFFSFIKSALFQFVSLQVDVLFKLIKGLIKDLDETPMDEVCQSS